MFGVTFLLFVTTLGSVHSVKIKFYDSLNYTGLFYEVDESPAECSALPSYGHGKSVSLITDSCIILHQEANCRSVNSVKLAKGQHDNLKQLGFGETFNGFQLCSEAEGGERLNVDLYYTTDLQNPAVKYKDVCGCIDMPNYVGTRHIMSVDNHHNCVILYEQKGCTGKSIEILGGTNAITRNLAFYFGVPTRSISSCADHAACLQLEARVFKFELKPTIPRAVAMANSLDFELAAKTTFRNNGSAIVTQEYHASKKIVESLEIFRSSSLTQMTRVHTEEDTEWGVNAGLTWGPFNAGGNFKKRFFEAHTMERNSSYQESEKYFSEETREFSVSQTIEISPCTLYEVSSVVKFMEDYPVNYVVHARISGSYAGLRLTTAQIRDKISSMEYVGEFDETTVIAKTTGTMTADFGIESLIDGEGSPIVACQGKRD